MHMFRYASILVLGAALVLAPAFAGAASLYFDPSVGTYGPGDTFIINVRLTTDSSQCINAGHVIVRYPTATLRAVDFGRGSSIFSLWVGDPKIDTDAGTIDFSGGIPGGYCGRIPGDAALSNILGGIVFSVVSSSTNAAPISFDPATTLYENDGLGTELHPKLGTAAITIAHSSVGVGNPWIATVSADTIPPEPFTVSLESTRGVFDGKYYLVFSTVDKQSGLDHYEAYVRGVWNRVESPYVLPDQSLKSPIEIRAIDKAGNARMGTLSDAPPPPRQYAWGDLLLSIIVLAAILSSLFAAAYLHHRNRRASVVDLRS